MTELEKIASECRLALNTGNKQAALDAIEYKVNALRAALSEEA